MIDIIALRDALENSEGGDAVQITVFPCAECGCYHISSGPDELCIICDRDVEHVPYPLAARAAKGLRMRPDGSQEWIYSDELTDEETPFRRQSE